MLFVIKLIFLTEIFSSKIVIKSASTRKASIDIPFPYFPAIENINLSVFCGIIILAFPNLTGKSSQ